MKACPKEGENGIQYMERRRKMSTIRLAFVGCVMVLLTALLMPAGAEAAGKTVYVGGTMSLTGPYAEDSAATLAGYEDYVKFILVQDNFRETALRRTPRTGRI